MKTTTIIAMASIGLGLVVGCGDKPQPVQPPPVQQVAPAPVIEEVKAPTPPKAELPDFKALSVRVLANLDKAHSELSLSRPISSYDPKEDELKEAALLAAVAEATEVRRSALSMIETQEPEVVGDLQSLFQKIEGLVALNQYLHPILLDHTSYSGSSYDPVLKDYLAAQLDFDNATLLAQDAATATKEAKDQTDAAQEAAATQRKELAEASRERNRAQTAYSTVVEAIRALEASKPRAPTPPTGGGQAAWARYNIARDRYTQDMNAWNARVNEINQKLAEVAPAKTAADAEYDRVKSQDADVRKLGIEARKATSAATRLTSEANKAMRKAEPAQASAKAAFDRQHALVRASLAEALAEANRVAAANQAALEAANAKHDEVVNAHRAFVEDRDARRELARKAHAADMVHWEYLDKELLRLIKWADSLGSLSDIQAISDQLRDLRSKPGMSEDTVTHINDAVRTLTAIR